MGLNSTHLVLGSLLLFGSCSMAAHKPLKKTVPVENKKQNETGTIKESPKVESAKRPPVPAATADFGKWWKAATIRVTVQGEPRPSGTALAVFKCEWTDGLGAGVIYPKKFIDKKTGKEVKMNFMWDSGGKIPAGTYDVLVDHDGVLGQGGWIRNLTLGSSGKTSVTVVMNAAMMDLPLEKYSQVTAFPPGTYADLKERGMLDSIPGKLVIANFNSENVGTNALFPQGKFDLFVQMADGTKKWIENFEIQGNRKIKTLP